ncbi:MAG: hypothetical protein IJN57_05815 [Oscillospiraceae bacterium]|nr:hypothetical protein [Oscillospiraceae bacterium]
MFRTILYLHDIGSSGGGNTVRLLREAYPDSTIISPELPTHPARAMEFIRLLRLLRNYDAVIGTSLGGFYAMQCPEILKILINPFMFAAEDIPRAIGFGVHEYLVKRRDGETTYTIDADYVSALQKQQAAFFGTQDHIVKHGEDFAKLYSSERMAAADFGHRMTEEVFYRDFLPFLEKVYAKENKSRPMP